MTPTAATVALEFSQRFHTCRGVEQMREVVERNRAETAPRAGYSHELCEVNKVIYAVFLRDDSDQ
jgi:hypothetical protein